MPKTILGPAEASKNAGWPYSRRHLLKPAKHLGGQPVQRSLYDSSSQWLPYRNGGQFPLERNPFTPLANRQSRRASGQVRGRLLGTVKARPALRTKSLELVAAERALRLARRRVELAGRTLGDFLSDAAR